MNKVFMKSIRQLLLVSVMSLGFISIIASNGGDNGGGGGGGGDYVGVWEFVSQTRYDEEDGCETMDFDEVPFSAYAKLTSTAISLYISIPDVGTVTCAEESDTFTVSGNTITDSEGDDATYSISGNTLTISQGTEQGCVEQMVFTRASDSDIAGAVEDCQYF